MGSWNATCQISRLPILSGESVRLMLLVRNRSTMDDLRRYSSDYSRPTNKDGFWPQVKNLVNPEAGREGVYSEAFWNAEFVPVRAVYEDSGDFQKVDVNNINWQYWRDTVKHRTIEYEKNGSNSAVKRDMELDELLDIAKEGRLRFKGYESHELPVCRVMVREDVYQSMLNLEFENKFLIHQDEEFIPRTIFEHGMKLFKNENDINTALWSAGNDGARFVNDDFENYFVAALHDDEFTEYGLKHYRGWITQHLDIRTPVEIAKRVPRGEPQILGDDGCMGDGSIKYNSPEFASFVKDIADFAYIKNLYGYMRLSWYPSTGCGSQGQNFLTASQFHGNVASIAKNVDEKLRARECEWEAKSQRIEKAFSKKSKKKPAAK